MIDSIKKNSLEFFNTNGLPSKKLENWKFTSSRNFKNFSEPLSNHQESVDFDKRIKNYKLSSNFQKVIIDWIEELKAATSNL